MTIAPPWIRFPGYDSLPLTTLWIRHFVLSPTLRVSVENGKITTRTYCLWRFILREKTCEIWFIIIIPGKLESGHEKNFLSDERERGGGGKRASNPYLMLQHLPYIRSKKIVINNRSVPQLSLRNDNFQFQVGKWVTEPFKSEQWAGTFTRLLNLWLLRWKAKNLKHSHSTKSLLWGEHLERRFQGSIGETMETF